MDRERPRVLSAGTLKGDRVVNPQGEDLGKVEEFMIDLQNGCVSYMVLSFGGIAGMGDKLFAIPWSRLTVDTDRHVLVLNMSKEELKSAPGFDKKNWPDMGSDAFSHSIYGYYGEEFRSRP